MDRTKSFLTTIKDMEFTFFVPMWVLWTVGIIFGLIGIVLMVCGFYFLKLIHIFKDFHHF